MEVSNYCLWFRTIIIVFLVLLLERQCEGCLEQERTALLQLKPFFNHPHYLRNWVDVKPNGSDCCKWKRVECNITSGRVIKLSLNSTRLYWKGYGYLNLSLFLPFEELKTLYLYDNWIAGFVGDKGSRKQLPINLEVLDLSRNGLKNSDLAYLNGLLNLKYLDISFNNLQGSINMKELNSLKMLKKLDMSGNQVEYLLSFQDGERQLPINLEVLDLRWNSLKNSTLAYFSGFSNLKSLDISNNDLQGSIDIEELNSLKALKKLDMSHNQIECLRSQDGERLMNLEELDLSFNRFNNSIFESLSGISNLKSLLINDNGLKGAINIKDLDGMKNLEELDISYNNLQEIINPKGNRGLRNLKVVHLESVFYLESVFSNETMSLAQLLKVFSYVKSLFLRNNYFKETTATQELPMWSKVEELILDGSKLNNSILQSIGAHTFPALKMLFLSNCGLKGVLPNHGWCDLRHLEWLGLDGNAFEGILPSCFGNLSSLRFLDISDNQFTGNSSSTSLANLTLLKFIDLSKNHFEVPSFFKSLANHSHLKVLLSDENQFVKVPISQTWTPQFQLNVFSLSNCTSTKQLPQLLHYQYDLRIIDFSYNKFVGRFPAWLLENNSRLENIFLNDNAFDGPLNLPSSQSNFNLFVLDISNNNIHGNIPPNICSIFPQLDQLYLSRNSLKGIIPPCLAGLDLLTLDLSHNGLSGGIPEEFGKSGFIYTLRLSYNNLSGNILPTIFRSLGRIYLDGNKFDGELPLFDNSTVSYSSLQNIDLSNNHLSGKLPSWIWNMSGLEVLALSNNHLEGPIPKEACYLQSLQFLDLSLNNISGSIPSCFNPPYIRHVHISRNRLSGPFTHAFYNSSSLVTLDLSENNLSGEIPSWFGTLSVLNVLLLKANSLTGEIPVELCKLQLLSIIDLSQNEFSGPIPSCLSNLTLDPRDEKSSVNNGFRIFTLFNAGLNYLNFDGELKEMGNGRFASTKYPDVHVEEQVKFTTKRESYAYKGNILDYMSGIDLSCNRLTGPIPIQLGNLREIRSLNLSHNNLFGPIPSSFSKLKQIESLDLSHNNLYGAIPIQLIELNALAVFNVSYNNLSGSIPSQKAQFGTFEESTYVGNDLLCGPPLHKNCIPESPPTVQNASDSEEENSFMDSYVFYVTFLVSYASVLIVIVVVLYINPYWRRTWFNFIQNFINACNYFVLDNLLNFSIFRRMYISFCY